MEKFEYKMITTSGEQGIIDERFQTKLNQLGENGWEMVNVMCTTGLGSSKYALLGVTTQFVAIFKRKKSEEE